MADEAVIKCEWAPVDGHREHLLDANVRAIAAFSDADALDKDAQAAT